jgi:hypothetical protein
MRLRGQRLMARNRSFHGKEPIVSNLSQANRPIVGTRRSNGATACRRESMGARRDHFSNMFER